MTQSHAVLISQKSAMGRTNLVRFESFLAIIYIFLFIFLIFKSSILQGIMTKIFHISPIKLKRNT